LTSDNLSDDLEEAVSAAERMDRLIAGLDEMAELVQEVRRQQLKADEAEKEGETWTAEK